MAIESYKGIKVPTAASDSVNSGTTTVGGILIDNDKNLADRVTAIESRNITNWKFGDAEPDGTLNPHEGDGYFRSTGMAYVYTNNAWSPFANLKGPAGVTEISTSAISGGTRITFGTGADAVPVDILNGTAPSVAVSEITGGHKVTITSGSTSSEFNVLDGADGSVGTNIFIGTIVSGTGTSISAEVTGSKANDLYINSSSGNLYIASAADTWNYLFTIKGTAGSAGTQIFTGTAVTGTDGTISTNITGSAEGDFYINSSTGNFYKAVAANSWNYMFCSKGKDGQDGDDGDDGDDGRDGTKIFTGTAVSGTGTDISATVSGSKAGDLYFNKTTCVLYKASAENLWDSLATLKGSNGTDGAGSGWTVATDSTSGSVSYTLDHGAYKIFTDSSVESLTLTDGLSSTGQTCMVEFTARSAGTSYTQPLVCTHFGDGCDSSGSFNPSVSTTYLMTFLKTYGGLKCFVKSM